MIMVPIDRVELSSMGYESMALPLSYTGIVAGKGFEPSSVGV